MPEILAEKKLISPTLIQFIKFCVIGLTSTVIDIFISKRLTYDVHLHWVLAKVISTSLAVTNGFIWNSLWTFKGQGSDAKHKLYMKFVAVNVVGLCLNITIMKLVMVAFTGKLIHQGTPDKFHWAVATGVAILCVSIWNFTANKRWTFGNSPSPITSHS